jgi:multisubunit Na+/H+ antiporter MnhC subunit
MVLGPKNCLWVVSPGYTTDVEMVSASGVAGGGLNWNNPFENLFKSNTALIITWVVIGIAILAVIIIGIILLKCLCSYMNKKKKNKETEDNEE